MYHKFLLFLITLFVAEQSFAQKINGMVADQGHQPLIGASILELNTSNGTITDIDGRFELAISTSNPKLVISYTGYLADTVPAVPGTPMHVMLAEDSQQLDEVVVQSTSTFFDRLDSKHTEIITEAELTKAACCNLSESFETNASVDVSFTDAVTGAKTIRMLGLGGDYVQINRENIPHVRGLSGRYGLGFVPGTWLQSIDVGKGAGTVVNGYESMTGQINVELKKPENSEKLYLNSYINSFGRAEINVNHARDLSDKWSTALLFHSNYFNSEIDQNKDGFLDLPKVRQLNVMNRYKYQGEKLVSQIGINVMRDEKAGGQTGFDFGDDLTGSSLYGFVNNSTRLEIFGKTGLLFQHKPYKGWGFIYSVSHLDIDGGFGRNNYKGRETTLYGNVIFQNIIGSSFHQYKTGVSMLYDDFDEVFADSTFTRREVVPGTYFEYSYLPNDRFSLITGGRTDFHNLFGTFVTPRLHTRYELSDGLTVRAAVGRGYRVANAIVESSNFLISSRQLIVQEAPEPEVTWNMGGSVVADLKLGGRNLSLVGDYFYTTFENQLIYDMDQNSQQLNVYNLDGRSFAHSFQLEASYQVNEYFSIKSAYKYYDVQTTMNGRLMQMPYVSRNRVFVNGAYATKYDRWKVDATLQWYGQKRLPNTSDKPSGLQRDGFSPDFFLLNAQISRGYRWGSVYVGSENLLGFTQDDPIIDPDNPFGDNFDASIVWAPIAGRMVYAGFRYKIKRI